MATDALADSCDVLTGQATNDSIVQDVLKLSDYSEASLIRTLSARFDSKKCYTYAGTILISLNPYDWIHGNYSRDVRLQCARIPYATYVDLLFLARGLSDPLRAT